MISLSGIRTIHLGMRSLLLHKMRSALTMLGIIFGVCSVIAMLPSARALLKLRAIKIWAAITP